MESLFSWSSLLPYFVLFGSVSSAEGLILRKNGTDSSPATSTAPPKNINQLGIRATPVQRTDSKWNRFTNGKHYNGTDEPCSFTDCCANFGKCEPRNCTLDSGVFFMDNRACDVLLDKGLLDVIGRATPNAAISGTSAFQVANIFIPITPTVFRHFAALPTSDQHGQPSTSTIRFFSAWGTVFIRNDTDGAKVSETTVEISRIPPQQRTHTYYIDETLSTTVKHRTVLDTGFYGDLYDRLRCGPYEVSEVVGTKTVKQTIVPITTAFETTSCIQSYAETATAQYTFLG